MTRTVAPETVGYGEGKDPNKRTCPNWPRCGCIMEGHMRNGTCDATPADTDTLGYLHTHWDCPACSEDNDLEGDRSGEKVVCTACGHSTKIREVR